MKTLSIKQPYASLIASGIKKIENRTWKTNFRGPVLIHAGASSSFHDLTLGLSQEQMDEVVKSNLFFPLDARNESYVKSAIIGQVDIVDCIANHPSIWAEKSLIKEDLQNQDIDFTELANRYGEVNKPTYNWVLANPILFAKPIENVKGRLSFWDYFGELPKPILSDWHKNIIPKNTHIAFGYNYYGGDPQEIIVCQVTDIHNGRFLVHFIYGHRSVAEYVKPSEILAIGDNENGTHKIPGWGGKYTVVNPSHKLAHICVKICS